MKYYACEYFEMKDKYKMKGEMSMRKRRFLAWLMTMVMAIGLMPATALADEPTVPQVPVENLSPDPVTVKSGTKDVAELSKTATYNEETGNWDVTLSVKATQPIESQPVEIVLVLDSSGSMAWCTTKEGHTHSKEECYTLICGKEEHQHTWECYSWGQVVCGKEKHRHSDNCYKFICTKEEHQHKGGTACDEVTSGKSKSRMQTVKDKAKEMVGEIIKIGGNVKIGVVDFDSEGYSSGSGALARIPLTEATAANKEAIENAIDAMKAEGGTWPDAGLNVADKMLKAGDPYAKKVVILLADGDADGSHGTAAETKATTMKKIVNDVETGVEFYTIGFMTDAGMLRNIASELKAEHNFTTTNEQALAGIFANIVKRLSAMISDPMGSMVDLDGTPVVSGSAIAGGDQTGLVVKSDQQIEWNKQGGLKSEEKVILNYSVSLDEEELLKLDAGSHEVALNGNAKLNYSYDHKGGQALFPVPKAVVETGQLVQQFELDGTVDNSRTVTGNKMIVSVSGVSKNANFTWNTPAATITADGTEYKYVETTYNGDPVTDSSVAAAAGVHTVVHKYTSVVDQNFAVAKALTKVDNTEVKEIKDNKVYDKNDKEVAIAKDSVLTYEVTLTNEGDALTNDTVVVNDSKFTSDNVSSTSVTVDGTETSTYTVDKTAGTLTINNVTLGTSEKIIVTYTYTVTEADVTAGKVENAASVENNTNPTDPKPEVVVPINNSTLVSSKTRVTEVSDVTWTTADQKEPAYNTDATPKIPKNESITLLFAVNVKNSIVNGAGVPLDYTVSDSNATYVGCSTGANPNVTKKNGVYIYSGTVAAGETVTLYFTMTFDNDDVKTGQNGSSYVENTAVVNGENESVEVPVNPLNNELSIAKERVTTTAGLPADVATAIESIENIQIDNNTVVVPYNGSVTLLYKVTVKNAVPTQTYALRGATPGLDYNVVDADAVYVGGDAQSGTLTNGHSAEMYFAKTFNKDTVGVDGAGNTVVTNTAKLDDTDKEASVETSAVVKVTVTYDSGAANDTTHQMEPDVVDKGEDYTVKESAFEYEGFEFVNWLGSDGKKYDADDVIKGLDEDLTLTAQWIHEGELSIEKTRVTELPDVNTVERNVEFDASEKPVIEYGGEITLLYKVTVTNTTPTTFSLRAAVPAGGNTYSVIDADATYVGFNAGSDVAYPKFEILPPNLERISGVLGPNESIDLYFTKTFEADDVENGKVFNTAVLNGTDEETDEGTDVAVEVRITFDPNASSLLVSGEMEDQTVQYGVEATLNENQFARIDGYAFVGWNTQPDGEGTSYTDKDSITVSNVEGITLYAQWEYASVVLTYNANGGKGFMWPETYSKGTEVTVKDCAFTAPAGQEFVGWSTSPDGKADPKYAPNKTFEIKDATILYAQWEPISAEHGTLTYHSNYGSGEEQTKKYEGYFDGELVLLNNCMFAAPAEMKFVGWGTEPDSESYYKAGDMMNIVVNYDGDNTDLYAIWKYLEITPPDEDELTGSRKEALTAGEVRKLDLGFIPGLMVPENGKIVMSAEELAEVKDFAIAYKITIEGDPNTAFKVTEDKNVEWYGIDEAFKIDEEANAVSGRLDDNGRAVLYCVKTFVENDVKDREVENTATIINESNPNQKPFEVEEKTEIKTEGVTVTKTLNSDGPFEDGDEVEFTITVTNLGNEDVENIIVVEEPGRGLRLGHFVGVEDGVDATPDEHVLLDESGEDEFTTEEKSTDEEIVDNDNEGEATDNGSDNDEAADNGSDNDEVADNDSDEEEVADPEEQPAEVPASDIIAAAEDGTETASEASSDEGMPYLDEDGNVVIPVLHAGQSIELTYVAKVTDGDDDHSNTVIVKDKEGNELDRDTNDDVKITSIDIDKEINENDTHPKRGGWVNYTITVTNDGEVTLTNINVYEYPGKVFSKGEFVGFSSDANVSVDFNGDEAVISSCLEPGESVTLTYKAKVDVDASKNEELKNYVEAEATTNEGTVKDDDTEDKGSVYVPSGGGIPSKDRPTKPSKVEEVLNTEDHFQYVQGYPDNTVGPERNITRAEATVIFFRLLNDSVRAEYLDAENAFPDVNMNDWFNLGVSTMENGGFVSGYDDGLFRPNANITRAELATIISNFDDLEPAAENKFADVEGHWAEKYINSAAEKGWLSGYEDGLFRPNQYITRAETMSMINRVLDRRVDADGLHAAAKQWKDNPESKWYYYAVLEATNYHEYERADVSDYENWTAIKAEKIWEN